MERHYLISAFWKTVAKIRGMRCQFSATLLSIMSVNAADGSQRRSIQFVRQRVYRQTFSVLLLYFSMLLLYLDSDCFIVRK